MNAVLPLLQRLKEQARDKGGALQRNAASVREQLKPLDKAYRRSWPAT
jgi:hypothetical protein